MLYFEFEHECYWGVEPLMKWMAKTLDTESFDILGHSFQILPALSNEIFLIGSKKGPGLAAVYGIFVWDIWR